MFLKCMTDAISKKKLTVSLRVCLDLKDLSSERSSLKLGNRDLYLVGSTEGGAFLVLN